MHMSSFRATFFLLERLVKPVPVMLLTALAAAPAVAQKAPLAQLSNGETISVEDFNAYLSRRPDLKSTARNYWGAEKALHEMLMTRVLVLEGERTKVERKTQPGEGYRFDDPYGLAVYRTLVKTCTQPSAAEAKRFFEQNPAVFTVPANARVGRVMLPASAKVGDTPAMGWLLEQVQLIGKGERSFEEAAKRASEVYKLEAQGDIGWVMLTDDVAIMRALKSANKGDLVGPVRDGDFVYLFLLGDKREPRQLKWSEAEPQAAHRALVHCREQANQAVTDKLFKQYGVVINDTAIKSLFQIPAPAAQPASKPAAVKPAAQQPASAASK